MFLRRTCAVAAVIVVGFAISSWLILGTLDRGRGGGWTTPVASAHGRRGIEWYRRGVGARRRTGPRRGFPPFVRFPVATAEDARPEVRDGDYVVGVELDGESRAYPLNMLSSPERHVVNDDLGGQPIAVTWCGLCQSPIVYARRVAGQTLVLPGARGRVYGENMVIQDVETGSEWPQLLGEAINGPLKGQSLAAAPIGLDRLEDLADRAPRHDRAEALAHGRLLPAATGIARASRPGAEIPARSLAVAASPAGGKAAVGRPSRNSSGSRSSTTRSRAWPSSSYFDAAELDPHGLRTARRRQRADVPRRSRTASPTTGPARSGTRSRAGPCAAPWPGGD